MDISALTSGTAATNEALTQTRDKSLGAQDFLQLLTVQLSNQDPLEPMKDTDFIAQMANFTSLEQMNELSRNFANFTESSEQAAAQAYLGRVVTLDAAEGEEAVEGVATAISRNDEGMLTVTIDEQPYPVTDIRRVQLPNDK